MPIAIAAWWQVVRAAFMASLCGWASSAMALHIVSDEIPDGNLKVTPGSRVSLFLDINPGDRLQWTWEALSGSSAEMSTQLFWTDVSGQEHAVAPLPDGQNFGNFDAPKDLMGARLEWHNKAAAPGEISWSYYATANFWTRPEYFLPAMLPLFLVAGAFYFGRRMDKNNAPNNRQTPRQGRLTTIPTKPDPKEETLS